MSLVLDCSVILAWVRRDEITPAVRQIVGALRQEGQKSALTRLFNG